jgi:hypothetical protein
MNPLGAHTTVSPASDRPDSSNRSSQGSIGAGRSEDGGGPLSSCL